MASKKNKKKESRKERLNWVDQIAIVGALASIAGLVVVALDESYRGRFVILLFAAILVISLAIVITRLTLTLVRFYRELRTVLDATEVNHLSAAHMKARWITVFKRDNTYRFHSTHLGIKYINKDGSRVKFFKTQNIIALQPSVNEIWDSELKADGEIVWNTFESKPGNVDLARKVTEAAVSKVPTVFQEALPVNEITPREMSVEMIDSFKKEQEDLGLRVSTPTETACISVELPPGEELLEPKGMIRFGRYQLEPQMPPRKYGKNLVKWSIKSPQIGEHYILTWRVR